MAKHKSNKWIKNRFAGADGIYSTGKYIVREDICSCKNGKTLYSRKYIRKTPQSIKECGKIIKCLTGNNK